MKGNQGTIKKADNRNPAQLRIFRGEEMTRILQLNFIDETLVEKKDLLRRDEAAC